LLDLKRERETREKVRERKRIREGRR